MSYLPSPGYLMVALLASVIAGLSWYLAHFVKKHKELPSRENGGAQKFIIIAFVALLLSFLPMFYYHYYTEELVKNMVVEFNAGKVFYCKESIGSPKLRHISKDDGFIYDEQRGAFVHKSDGSAYLPGMGGENCR